ncbi:DUF2786 domain-containing protein [Marinactinospora thermotolerans]|uniref:DUF2786 domain-containing protein n=1 Tax=Marinactinospora thermotolerans TaxID=531310 RepID=UPI003D8C5639
MEENVGRSGRNRGGAGGEAPRAERDGDAASPDELISAALAALARGDSDDARRRSDRLVARPDEAACRAVDRALFTRLVRTVSYAWPNGWQPAELVRHVRRENTEGGGEGALHARLATDVIAAEARRYDPATVDERWSAQLEALGATVWWEDDDGYVAGWAARENAYRAEWVEAALEVLHTLSRLPAMATLLPPPGRGRRGPAPVAAARGAAAVPSRMLERVRALLRKAESTEFPQEAEALTARAQELMARHSIDHALLAVEEGAQGEGPVSRRLPVDDPYDTAKAVLLDVVAGANRCRAVWDQGVGLSTVVGFAEDVEAVELLFTSLLVQADTAMVAAEARQRAGGRKRTKTFRQSFLAAFAQRIGERLDAAADAACQEARERAPEADLLPMLAARDVAVAEAADAMFPETVTSRVRGVHDHAGWRSGRDAADAAPLRPAT